MNTITDEQKAALIGAWFSEEWAQEKARGMLDDYEALGAPATEPEKCWCDEHGIGEPGVSCGDCPTRDYKATAPAQPSWHDAPTVPGLWVTVDGRQASAAKIPKHELSLYQTTVTRWFGPVPPDSGDKP